MTDDHVPSEGEVATVERTFSRDVVEAFTELSRDRGTHHLEPDAEGGYSSTACCSRRCRRR